ncbi:MAG: sodium/proton-translocating pyrophosphatase, partial [Candidatus Caldatribacteriota bacterium]
MVILKLLVILSGVIALFYAMILARQVLKEKEGNELMQYLSRSIEKGAMTFLRREYSILI